MFGLFSRKRIPVHVPPTGPITLTKAQFCTVMRTRPPGGEYIRLVGEPAGQTALENAFTESLRSMNQLGFWSYGTSAGHGHVNLRFSDDATLKTFFEIAMDTFFSFDIRKIRDRATYTNTLKTRAMTGALYNELKTKTEVESNYYTAPPPRTHQEGIPVVPPKPLSLINLDKAIAWATASLTGGKSSYVQTILEYTKFDGSFPLGPDTKLLDKAFTKLVQGAPAYRGWNNTASQQKYPSNIGGKKVLNDILSALALTTMPSRGDTRWYDLALYVFGSIIAVQAFTDGNKRMARFAYILMLMSGGVDMIAPTDRFGGELGNMM